MFIFKTHKKIISNTYVFETNSQYSQALTYEFYIWMAIPFI